MAIAIPLQLLHSYSVFYLDDCFHYFNNINNRKDGLGKLLNSAA